MNTIDIVYAVLVQTKAQKKRHGIALLLFLENGKDMAIMCGEFSLIVFQDCSELMSEDF